MRHMVTNASWFADNPLATFLPKIQLQCLASSDGPHKEAWQRQYTASLLLVDVSGFTELTERFARQGAAAVEELSKILNSYFGRMADVIAQHGGDILMFAGDAALVLWPVMSHSEEELSLVTCRAAQGAQALQNELIGYGLPHGITLRQRAAVGAGPVTIMEVGGCEGRWQFVVVGDAISQAGEAGKQANSGDVLLSTSAWKLVQDRCAGTVLPSGCVKLDKVLQPVLATALSSAPVQNSVSTLQSYVLPIVVERLRAGHGDWLAEFRNVAVLFVQLSNRNGRNPDSVSLHAAVGEIQSILMRREGCVYQFVMDDKGIVLIGAFGLASPAHEDDPARGVRCALAIQTQLQFSGMEASIGVASGRAFCGVIGSATRRQYTAVGSVMNMSARLMQAAAGRVLCDQTTFQSAQSNSGLHFETPGEIRVKGIAEPLTVYIPSRAESRKEHGVVGREAERSLLTRALEDLVQKKQGSLIVFEGEPGIGKSRLIEYLLVKARKFNVPCLLGGGDAVEASRAYYGWQSVFQTLFRIDPLASTEAQTQRVTSALQDQADLLSLAPLLSSVLPIRLSENEITSQMKGKVRADNIQALLLKLLARSTASAPHVLILEDAHWLDPSSLAVAALVVQQEQPMLTVITTRPFSEAEPPEFETIRRIAGHQCLKLDMLEADSALEIARQCLGVRALPSSVEDFLERRAGGQPFFIQELAYALRDAGLIHITQGQCRIAEGIADSAEGMERAFGALNIPNSIQGVITSRVDRLPSQQQLTLKVASVIGRTFALFLLQEIHPVSKEKNEIPSQLERLEQADLTHRMPTADPTEEFKHALIQEVVYVSVSFANRRQLHRAIAEWYEKHHQQDLASYYPLLAYHWRHAEVVPKAIEFAIKAGVQALGNFANQEAIRFLREALELYDQSGNERDLEQALCRLWLGRAQVNLSSYVEARTNLEFGLAALGQPVPNSTFKASLILLGEVLRQIAHRLRTKVASARDSKGVLEAARAYQGLMEIFYVENAPVHTLVASMKSLNLAESAAPSAEVARGYASLGAILGFIPWHRAAAQYCRRALATAEGVNDLSAVTWVLMCQGIYQAGLGQWDEADHGFRRMAQISTQLGDARSLGDANQCRAMLHYLRGKFATAVDEAEELHTLMVKRGDHRLQAEALRWKANGLLALGKMDLLPSCLAQLSELRASEKKGGILNLSDVHALQASLYLRRREYPQSLQAVEEAASRLAKISNTSHELIVERAAVASVYLNLWAKIQCKEWDAPSEVLRRCRSGAAKACKALRGFTRVFPIGQPATWLSGGRSASLAGNASKARTLWARGVASSQKLKMPYEEGLIEFEIGRSLRPDGKNREHLQRACDLFRAVGAGYDLGTAEGLLRTLDLA
jgi:class 3 adenylate cyclase/tetratricopeptide (TPR) repeat protein